MWLGVWLTSLCVLMLELALTRVFSATMYYHFAFLAISLALLGSGASGIAVYAGRNRLAAHPPPTGCSPSRWGCSRTAWWRRWPSPWPTHSPSSSVPEGWPA